MAGNPTPVFRDDQNVSKASARSHLPHRVGSVSDVRATNFAGVYRIYVSENRRNYDFIPSDATSPDDGFTVIVGPNGERWKHVDIDGSGGGAFDVVVPNIAARAAYDDEKEGFLVLVESDSGHSNDPWGYAKDSDASGDWTAGFPIRGPAVSDGDKGDIVVSGSGTTWTIEAGAITDAKLNDSAIRFAGVEESVASAGTINLTSTKARVLITGTTVTTTVTMGNNQRRILRVQDGWMLNASFHTRWYPAGSIVVLESDGAGNPRIVSRNLPFGATPHLEAQDPFPVAPYKPAVNSNWSAKPYLDDGWMFSRASTTTYFDSKGILRYAAVNEPVFDTIWGTGERGLQYFGARTNMLPRSHNLSIWWTATRSSVSSNVDTAPDGTASADKLVEDNTAGNSHFVASSSMGPITGGSYYTLSFFAKPSGRTRIEMAALTGTDYARAFDLTGNGSTLGNSLGVTNPASYGIEALPNGWYRCWITFAASGQTHMRAYLRDGATAFYAGDSSSGVLLWGAQLEGGLLPSPYIATDGSQVTRASDVLYRDLPADIVNQNEMALYTRGAWRYSVVGQVGIMATLGANNATFGSDAYLYRSYNVCGLAPGSAPVNANSSVGGSFFNARAAARIKTNDMKVYVNGGAGGLDTDCTVPAGINRLTLGGSPWGGAPLDGNLMEVALWSRGLPDATLQAIST